MFLLVDTVSLLSSRVAFTVVAMVFKMISVGNWAKVMRGCIRLELSGSKSNSLGFVNSW